VKPPKTLTVNVTREDIDRGAPGFNSLCPIALAVNRRGFECRVFYPGEADIGGREYRLSPAAVRFVADFDAGRPVKPIKFRARRRGT
jgi:hypothetical protein